MVVFNASVNVDMVELGWLKAQAASLALGMSLSSSLGFRCKKERGRVSRHS